MNILMRTDLRLSVSLLSYLSHAHSRHQLSDVTDGLCYLHFRNVIHGDLKGVCYCFEPYSTIVLTPSQPNILVDDSGRARITDFSQATIAQNQHPTRKPSRQLGFTVQWAAPEVLEGGTRTTGVDIFSFAMVMIEVCCGELTICRALAYCRFVSIQVFTGAPPFGNCGAVSAMKSVISGTRPPRPAHPTFTDDLWMLVQRCWGHDPHLRPDVSEVLNRLRSA